MNRLRRFLRHRQHPIKLLAYTSKNLWLLLIPLSKRLIAEHFNFQSWIVTNWVDIVAISGIFAIAVLRWIFVRFNIDTDGIVAYTGLFGMVRTKVYFSEITSASFCQSWYGRAVKAHTIYIETNAQTVSAQDLKLVLTKRNADILFKFIDERTESRHPVNFSPRKLHLLVFSILFSSALSGVILYATFMFEAYKIIGLEREQKLVERVNGELTKIDGKFLKITEHVPQAVILLVGIVLAGWVLSFIATISRHWSFTVSKTDRQFFIKSGVLIKRRHLINRDKVNYYDITQTLLMKLFKICSVTLDCTGYGKSRREISALIPITTYKQMNASLKLLVPDLPKPKPEIKTGKRDINGFVAMPLWSIAVPPVLIWLLKKVIPDRQGDIEALLIIMLIPLVWLVIVKAAAAFNTSVGFSEKGCMMSYCKWYKFHKIFMPKDNISKIRITRNPFQRLAGQCTLWIYTVGEKEKFHKMKFMPYEDIKRLCLREGYIMFE